MCSPSFFIGDKHDFADVLSRKETPYRARVDDNKLCLTAGWARLFARMIKTRMET